MRLTMGLMITLLEVNRRLIESRLTWRCLTGDLNIDLTLDLNFLSTAAILTRSIILSKVK